ncbi:MAG: hypothetical protein GEV06_05830 [Luteitalea sp.]|nr:hypothetical protein [Luteitalea sp.]
MTLGQDLAALLLGYPSGGAIDRSADRFNQVIYHGLFVQDDWKVSDKLTFNLGLRWEYEGPPTERFNRNARGFDPDAQLDVASAAQTAYAADPIPELSPSDFRVQGGLGFASDSDRGSVDPDWRNIQPRLGFAYQWNERTVVRGGWAIYTVPGLFDYRGIYQPGFSQGTTIVPSLDTGVTIRATLDDPFPDGVAEPPGAANGANTFVGRSLGRFNHDVGYQNGQSMRWAVSMQRELPAQWVVEAAYVGNRAYDLTMYPGNDFNINSVPREYLSTSSVRDQATIDFLTANVDNPLAGLLPGEDLDSSTVQRQQLLRPYPQFSGINTRPYEGSSSYASGQFRLEKRFSTGFTMLTSYTYAHAQDKLRFLNETDAEPEERSAETDIRHRLVLNGIWDVPFGRDRRFGADAHPVLNAIAGNWSVSLIWQWQSGRANLGGFGGLGNVYYDGDINQLKTDYSGDVSEPVFDTSGFYFQDEAVQTNGVVDPAKQRSDERIRLANNIRTLPTRPDQFADRAT